MHVETLQDVSQAVSLPLQGQRGDHTQDYLASCEQL